jgi:mRNA (guanine-N7-)-methyltransferase
MDQDNATHVAEHYNAIPQLGLQNRKHSQVYHLRSLHNWIKSILIQTYTSKGDRVLDLCCGKGGDLSKWHKSLVKEVVGVDIADVSIKQAQERYTTSKYSFQAEFYTGDVFSQSLESLITPANMSHPFDVVSCQFAYHYSWESEAKARMGLQNISKALKPGGHFLATTPNANWIVYFILFVDFKILTW